MPMKSTCGRGSRDRRGGTAHAEADLDRERRIAPEDPGEVDRCGGEGNDEARRQRGERARLTGADPARTDDEAADARRISLGSAVGRHRIVVLVDHRCRCGRADRHGARPSRLCTVRRLGGRPYAWRAMRCAGCQPLESLEMCWRKDMARFGDCVERRSRNGRR